MPKVEVYFFKDIPNMPFAEQQDIVIFGQPKVEFIKKHYVHVYDIDEKRKINNMPSYLRYLVQKFTFEKKNPLLKPEKVKYLESIKSHYSIAIGDIFKIDDEYYAVEYDKCTKIS